MKIILCLLFLLPNFLSAEVIYEKLGFTDIDGREVVSLRIDGGIELDDDDFGLFQCPHCDEEFEWNSENPSAHEDLFMQREFWIGSLVPFLTTCLGLFVSFIAVGGSWDFIAWGTISILLWPIVAIGIGIYGFMKMRSPLWFGAVISLAISVVLFLLFVVATFAGIL